jgi:type I restriction enzyme S subunit
MTDLAKSSSKATGIRWFPHIPSHWEIVPFKHLVDIRNGRDHKEVEQEQGYPVLGSGGVFAHASEYLYDGEAILLGRKGTIDKPLHFNGRFWAVDTMYWSKIRKGVNGRFAYYAATTIPFDFYKTSTALPSMTKSILNAHPVSLPPLSEQRIIADFLDRETARIDTLIEKKRSLASLANERLSATLENLTFGNPSFEGMLIPFKWVCRVTEGQVDPTTEAWKDKPLIAPNHIEKSTGRLSTVESADEKGAISGKYAFPAGTVLYSKIRPALMKACITPEAGLCSADMYPILPSSKLLPEFLLMQLLSKSFTDWAVLESMRVAMPKINRERLGSVCMVVPPIPEQREAVAEFTRIRTAIDRFVDLTLKSAATLTELRSSLITAAVTGQIDPTTYRRRGTTDRTLDRIEKELSA